MKAQSVTDIKAMADKVISVTMDQAAAFPGFLGKIIPCHLREVGYYTRTDPDTMQKIFYELAK
mgnify:CR=1 FL=1